MLILLPLLSLTGCTLWLATRQAASDVREAFLQALVAHGLLVAVTTELLSAGRQLTATWVTLVWTFAGLAGGLALVSVGRRSGGSARLAADWRTARSGLRQSPAESRLAVAGVMAILGVSLFVALAAPPNNPDSVAYHMPRVMHWVQNATVAHYPAHDLRQISFPGGAEYVITHLWLLTGGDHFANLVQWLAFFGCVLGVSLLAGRLGQPAAQLQTALVAACLPMAVLQSMTTQNDLAVSLWILCFGLFASSVSRVDPATLLWPAAALGLAYLTKPTAYVFAVGLLLVLALELLGREPGAPRHRAVLKAGLGLVAVVVVAASLSLPHFVRNTGTFGTPLGVDTGTRNTRIGVAPLLSNMMRNLAINAPLPVVWSLVRALHEPLGLDPSEAATTFPKCSFEPAIATDFLSADEDLVASPLHLLLFILSGGLLLSSRADPERRGLRRLLLAVVVGFLAYCLLIRWQYWGNRLLLPLAILGCPIIGSFLQRFRRASFRRAVTGLLLATAIGYGLIPFRRPLVPLPAGWTPEQSPSILGLQRMEIYFSSYLGELVPVYVGMVRQMAAQRCDSVGLRLAEPRYEYALWILAGEFPYPVRFRNVEVDNVSRALPPEFPDEETCARIVAAEP